MGGSIMVPGMYVWEGPRKWGRLQWSDGVPCVMWGGGGSVVREAHRIRGGGGSSSIFGGSAGGVGGAPGALSVPWHFGMPPPLLAAPRLGVPNGPPDVKDELIWEGEVPEL